MSEPQELENEEIPHDQGTAEDQASRLGWVPQDQYKGKRPWVDAAEYLERLREDSPRLRHVNDKLVRQVEELTNTNAAILAHHERQIVQERQEAYDRAHADAEARHAQAVAAGDLDGAAKAVTTMKALDKQISNVPQKKPEIRPEEKQALSDFKSDNSGWYGVDPDMTKFANEYQKNLLDSGTPIIKSLEMTLQKVQRRFPQEFSDMNNDALNNEPPATPRTQAPRQAVPNRNNSSGVRRAPPPITPGSYEALSPKGKAACDAHVRAFAEPKKASAKATWLKFARNDASLFN